MKIAKVFKQGNSQAVRLPREFRVAEDSLFIRKSGDAIILTPSYSSILPPSTKHGRCGHAGHSASTTAIRSSSLW